MPTIPKEILDNAYKFARFKGMDVSKLQLNELLRFLYPSLIKHAMTPKVEIKPRREGDYGKRGKAPSK